MKVVLGGSRLVSRAVGSKVSFVLRSGLLALLGMVALSGCSDNPTSPEGQDMFVFDATLEREGRNVHEAVFSSAGTLRLTMTDLRAVLLDTTALPEALLAVQFELARRVNGVCNDATSRLTFREGQVFLIDIVTTDYCFTISDPGFLPEGSTIGYTLVVELAET